MFDVFVPDHKRLCGSYLTSCDNDTHFSIHPSLTDYMLVFYNVQSQCSFMTRRLQFPA